MASLLNLEPDIEVVAQVSRGDEVVAPSHWRPRPTSPCSTSKCRARTGLDAADALARELPDCRILILTTFGRPGYLRRAMEGGAAGFLLKDGPASELAAAIRRAVAGERVVDPGLAAAALSQGESPLTPREHEVLSASREHATVAELAGALYLSPGTVRNHLSSAMQKLDARNRSEAVRVAEETGLVVTRSANSPRPNPAGSNLLRRGEKSTLFVLFSPHPKWPRRFNDVDAGVNGNELPDPHPAFGPWHAELPGDLGRVRADLGPAPARSAACAPNALAPMRLRGLEPPRP